MRALPLLLLCISAIATVAFWQQSSSGHAYGKANIGGGFQLVDTTGHQTMEADFRGRMMLVYMGYSYCPDVCPMTLSTMSETLKLLGPDANKVAAIFITLDPERDTPQVLHTYLAHFDKRIIGLTGSKEAIKSAAEAYKAYYAKSSPPNTGSYLVDHSGFLYLMDKEGKYVTHFGPDVKAEDVATAIRKLL